MSLLSVILLVIYCLAALGVLVYGLNCYVMIALFHRVRGRASARRQPVSPGNGGIAQRPDLPSVITQIPVYNEMNVVERAMRAACGMCYPRDRHLVQVLDDSTDGTRALIDRVAADLKGTGARIQVIRRADRVGFKAGALAEGMRCARGDLLAVFDADFVPPRDFLYRTVGFFLADPALGLVQTRWGHLNRCRSLLTRAQAIGIDGHFMVEQAARNWNGLFMNFNGTAGLWRREAIEAGGGWQWDTLTEDMDLSYRTQLAGWQTVYLPDIVVPAEIPEDMRAFKSQQFRWAKGSIQTALKLMPAILSAPVPRFKKLQAFFHMTHYMVHPLMLVLATLALPVLLTLQVSLSTEIFVIFGVILCFSLIAPNALYLVSQQAAYRDWKRRIWGIPALAVIGVGIAVSNTRAVSEALLGVESDFIRTPKRGERSLKAYGKRNFPWIALVEMVLGCYCLVSFSVYLSAGKYLVGPFLAVYAAGFLYTGLLTAIQSVKAGR
jgi:cellulose synthase/poly-beta-1,6-N-acetylglucosamine synthase-like glycosyltransferase